MFNDSNSETEDTPEVQQMELETPTIKNDKKRNYAYIAALVFVGLLILISFIIGIVVLFFMIGRENPTPTPQPKVIVDESVYFSLVKQITFGHGTSAEAYWSPDGKELIFQGQMSREDLCDKIYTINADGSNMKKIDYFPGISTCSYYFQNDTNLVTFASSMDKYGPGCPPKPDSSFGYVWPLYNMQMYVVDRRTNHVISVLNQDQDERCKDQSTPHCYNAEATITKNGDKMVFTSTRSGDLELYSLNLADPTAVPKRLTFTIGYDGGAFYSNDGTKIVWRAGRPVKTEEMIRYKHLLDSGMVEGTSNLEVYIMNEDGSNQKKITNHGGASFAPNWLPDDSGIIFSSNFENPRIFHLYIIDIQGKGLRRITNEGTFNGFPMFSPDGKKLAFSSNRGATTPYSMHVHIADWKGFSFKTEQ